MRHHTPFTHKYYTRSQTYTDPMLPGMVCLGLIVNRRSHGQCLPQWSWTFYLASPLTIIAAEAHTSCKERLFNPTNQNIRIFTRDPPFQAKNVHIIHKQTNIHSMKKRTSIYYTCHTQTNEHIFNAQTNEQTCHTQTNEQKCHTQTSVQTDMP